jgi:predicted nucleotidyltransferase
MRFGLSDETITKIESVLSHYPQIEEAVIYGSRAKGTFKNGSDIDIALVGDRMDVSLINRIAGELDDLLLPYTFDISSLCQIDNPALRDHIDRVGMVFFRKSSSSK